MKSLASKNSSVYLIVFAVLLTFFSAVSCKEKTECKATIMVVHETSKAAIVNAEVTPYCTQNTCVIEETAKTGLDGKADFSFEKPGILQIEVVYDDSTYDGKYVELIAGETVEEIVELPL